MNNIVVKTAHVVFEDDILQDMTRFAEKGYPEEVVGFLFGIAGRDEIVLHRLLEVENRLGAAARHHRYVISPADWSSSETEAKRLELDVLGVFHTHPDHPARPSAVDLEFALPNLVYVIAAIHKRKWVDVRAWELREDRAQFDECLIRTRQHS